MPNIAIYYPRKLPRYSHRTAFHRTISGCLTLQNSVILYVIKIPQTGDISKLQICRPCLTGKSISIILIVTDDLITTGIRDRRTAFAY